MSDRHKTKAQLIQELEALRAEVAALKTGQTTAQVASLSISPDLLTHVDPALLDEAGNLVSILSLAQDISVWVRDEAERQRAEIALQESEAKYSTIFQVSPDPIWVATLAEGRCLEVNDSFCRFLDLPRNQILDQTCVDLQLWNNLDDLHHFRQTLIHQGYIQDFEVVFRRCSGGTRTVLLSARLSRLHEQDYVIGMLKDITERKALEANLEQRVKQRTQEVLSSQRVLQEQEQFLRSIYEGFFYPIFVVDVVDGYQILIRDWNLAAAQTLGLSSTDAAGKEIQEIFEEQTAAAMLRHYDECLRTGQSVSFEEQLWFQGQPQWRFTTYNPLKDSQGRIYRIVGTSLNITDRKQAEQALQESEERLRLALRAANQGLYDLNIGTGEAIVNAEYATMLGYDPAEFRETNAYWIERLHPDDMEPVANTYKAYVSGELSEYKVEFRQRTRSGKWKWILSLGKIVAWDEAGQPLRMLGTHTDINDRKVAEQALRESEERFRQLAETVNEVFWLVDTTGKILYISPAYERIWQRPLTELLSESGRVSDSVHPDDRALFLSHIPTRLETGRELEYRIVRPSGEIRWIRDRTFPIRDRNNQTYRIAGIGEDITEQKRLEQEEQKLLAILEASTDYIGICTPQGQIVWLNRQIKQLHGIPEDADVSQLQITLSHPQWVLERLMQEAFPAAAQQGTWVGETVFLAQNGREVPTSQMILAHKNEAGEVEYYSTIARDISFLKEAELALRQANTELEKRVEDRTAELRQAKEAAEAANRSKSTFLANMSHELRTPLNAILGFAQLMSRDGRLEVEHRNQLSIINRSGEHLLNLINDVLDLSKIEAGRIELTPDSFDVLELLQGLRDMFQQRAEEKGLQFSLSQPASLPRYLTTDAKKLNQVLINLLSNAIKFTTQGSITLKVCLNSGEEPGDHTLFCEVTDTGIGISAADQTKIFDAFTQVQTGKLTPEGTGLGLTISHNLIRLMGGELQVRSCPEQGSTFYFQIPVTLAHGSDSTDPPERQVMGLAPGQPMPRILVVDDHSENRQLLIAILTRAGLEAQEAVDAQEMIERWQQWQPDLIWMDVRMPGMSGYEAAHLIRAQPGGQTVVILAITAQAEIGDRQLAIAAGCNDLVRKPFQEATVFAKMAEYLNLHYLYADHSGSQQGSGREGQAAAMALTPADVAEMSPQWVVAVHEAALDCDEEKIYALIEQIPPTHSQLILGLSYLVHDYEFQRIMELTQL